MFNRRTILYLKYKKIVLLKIYLKNSLPINIAHLPKCIGFLLKGPVTKVTATYAIFNRKHAGVTHVNMCEFLSNRRIFTEVITWTDRPTDKPKSLTHFSTFVRKC